MTDLMMIAHTMHREYVMNTNYTNTSNYRVVKVLPDTGSTPSNFESEERKPFNAYYISTNKNHQPTTVSMALSGAHTVVSNKNEMFNLLLFNKLKPNTELLMRLIARTIETSI